MKKVNKINLFMILMFCIMFGITSNLSAQIDVYVNDLSSLTPGSTTTVQVRISSPSTLSFGYDLNLNYDKNVLTYVSKTPYYPTTASFDWYANPTSTGLVFGYVNISGGVMSTYPTNTLVCEFTFTFNGGTTTLTVDDNGNNSATGFFDDGYNYLAATFHSGSANGSYATITSVSGGGNWSSPSTWDLGHVPNTSNGDVIINSNVSSPVLFNATTSYTGNVTVNPNKAITINNGTALTLNGNFLIKSDASGTGSFINYGTYTASNTTVERYLPNWPSTTTTFGPDGWHMISSPVANHSLTNFTPTPASSYDFFKLDETTLQWLDQKIIGNNITSFQSGIGYLVAYQNAGTHNFSGTLINSNVSPAITYTTTIPSADNGYNLVGNPYTSALDASDINTANWPKTNVNSYVYVYDDASQQYLDWNGTIGSLSGGIIPAMQGFLISANAPSPTFTIPAAKRVHNSQNLYKSTINDLLKLSVLSSNGFSDIATIYFSNDNTNSLDANVDVPKQFGPGQESPNLYSFIGSKIYSTNAMGTLSNVTIPLGFEPKINGAFIIKANEYSSFPAGTSIILQDLKTGVSKNLMQNHAYSFTANTTDNVNRFNLIFSTTAGISENNVTPTNSIYSFGKDIFVDCSETKVKQISIYNTIGQVVYTVNNPVGMFKYTLNGDNTTGYYIVKVITDKNVNSEKVFVK